MKKIDWDKDKRDQQIEEESREEKLSKLAEEARLLEKVNQGLPPAVQQRYDELTAKRRAETLTSEEYQELLTLLDRIERADAERAQALTELAQLRKVSVMALMTELGIRPPDYA